MARRGLRRDSFGEGSKAKGRLRRNAGTGPAEAEKASGRSRRNDILPLLRIEHCPVDALKLHVRKLRKNKRAHVRELANAISTLGFNVPLLIGKDDVVRRRLEVRGRQTTRPVIGALHSRGSSRRDRAALTPTGRQSIG